jgi:hypothetical protein
MYDLENISPRLVIEIVANYDISDSLDKTLKKKKTPKNINQMWRKAEHKGEVQLFKKGFLWDSWSSYSMIVFETHIIYFKEKYSAKPSGFIPLFK